MNWTIKSINFKSKGYRQPLLPLYLYLYRVEALFRVDPYSPRKAY